MSEEEINEFRKRFLKQRDDLRRFGELPEAKHQAGLFTSWVSLGGIGTPLKAPKYNMFWCVKCKKWEELKFECGLSIEDAIELLRNEIPAHAQIVKEARKKMEKK